MSAYLDHSASDAAEWEPFFREPHLTLVEYARDLERQRAQALAALEVANRQLAENAATMRRAMEALADVSRPYRVGRAS